MDIDRRRLSRVPCDLRVDDRTASVRTVRTATDLSLDGMRLSTTRAYAVGAILDLEVRLNDRPEPLRVQAQVVGAGEREVSLRFVGLRTRDRVRIVECMFG